MPPPRDRPRSRHRAPAPGPAAPREPAVEDPELNSYLAALAGSGEHETELTGRFGSAQVFQLRLPALRIEQLRRIADDRGVSPGALAVDWVIERLNREDTPTGPIPVVDGGSEETQEDRPHRGLRGLRRLGRRQ
ncbi:hypothetical protein [Pseudonocardia xinjiangensis]|jgi:hypothetical protein|uniref:CopG family transcriptional regulator n=1 Tax=Pseudonocardia xinjiangensis TaxID=75289 RepID=A0ABX1RK18_9PSEU|nr:hypothetical protein [Pseudonocardia xinjiangensis]NMH79568.1 hypothetical protein [Pseudonocardia xinjiangensis]